MQGTGVSAAAEPLVSVSISAYNLERLLPRALDSVLMQEMPFPVEVIVGDDCSTDGTLKVAQEYARRHPELIQVMSRSKNVGIQRNTDEILERCRGKYTAWLDADDYWTDPKKLVRQVAALEADPSIQVCGHYARWVNLAGEVKRERYPSLPAGRYQLNEILRHNFIATPTIVFRSGAHRLLPEWYFGLDSLSDWPVWVFAALSGDILLMDETMADYTLSANSSFMSKGEMYWYRSDARFLGFLQDSVPTKYRRVVRAELGRRYGAMAYALRKRGEFSESRIAAWKAFSSPALTDDFASKSKGLLAAVVREMEWRIKGSPAG
jgi:glycosyltransferase involved in cell wall biosynthesis